jgi:hypothetical protein
MKLNTRELTFIGLSGVLMFLLSFLFGSVLNVVTGNPSASGFITQIIQGIILTITLLTIRKFWTGTIMWLIYGILAMPTNMFGGFPGPYKVVLCLILGLFIDSILYIFKYRNWSLYLAGLVTYIVEIPIVLYLYTTLKVPGAELVIKYWPFMIGFFFVEFCLGIWIGTRIFNKIKDKKAIVLIMGSK